MEKNNHTGFGFDKIATVDTKHVTRLRHVYARTEIRPWQVTPSDRVIIRFELEILMIDDANRIIGQSPDGVVQQETTLEKASTFTAEWALNQKAKDEEAKAISVLKQQGQTKRSFLEGLKALKKW